MPEGLEFIASWVGPDFTTCFQVMQTRDASLFAAWTDVWKDLIDFEIMPVRTSAEAAQVIAPRPVRGPGRRFAFVASTAGGYNRAASREAEG